ncbi:hypothetical protein [Salipaludibacillus aurantiacus]|uniref:Intein N-terminal splicing region n=1 Tax=Salipaludibacillus aurantiacus TaxID=1601833 RepID=A0A1H9TZK1_9BACI|nr:hypothetical protein [Salipaludibacillus aurantiacus]SES02482.1 intein N-terminal splicing region [Salipaludibacillus aurantiacus]
MDIETRIHLKDGRTIAIEDAFNLHKSFLDDFRTTRNNDGDLTFKDRDQEITVKAKNIVSFEIAILEK